MPGPISQTLNLGHGAEMSLGLLLGLAFGFVLERGGFGRADNLAAIFYGRDFRVLRVMFTAIVVGMLGLYLADLVGLLPLWSIGLLDTYWAPQLVGGLLLGAGFIVGGYCPGTSLVAAASGKTDALLFIAGLPLGALLFTVGYDGLETFHRSTALGRVLLPEALGLPAWAVVLGVVGMAVGAFAAVKPIEDRVRGLVRPGPPPEAPPPGDATPEGGQP